MTLYYEDPLCRLYVGDAQGLPLEDESVDVVVTSPPYNVGKAYDGVEDLLEWAAYRALVRFSCGEMARVLKPGGRVWVNVAAQTDHPDDGEAGRRQDLSRIWQDGLEQAGLWWRDTIVWDKRSGNNSSAWGSKLSPNAPNLRGRYEPILLFFKGSWTRGRVEQNDLTMPEFLEFTRNVWTFGTTGPSTNGGHPCPFPRHIPYRALKLSTWPGDVVLDPFCGSGTTIKVAKDLGRYAIGVDLSEKYVEQTRRRIAQEAFAL